MNECCKRLYSKGYYTGGCKKWPAHKPPTPPNEHVKNLMEAARELRDAADHICATLVGEDEFIKELSPGVDSVDKAMCDITEWLYN